MTSAQIVGLGVRLFAVWLVVSVLRHVPHMWQFNESMESGASAYVAIVVVAVLIWLLAAGLWFFPLTVAKNLTPSSNKTDYVQLPLEQSQSIGFTLLGLWVLGSAVPDSLYWLFMIYQASIPETLLELGTSHYAKVVSTAVEVILGIWLLFGARGLPGLLRWARSAKVHVLDELYHHSSNAAHGVEVPAGARLLFTNGQVGTKPDGTTPETTAEQGEVVFTRLAAVLGAANMALSDIARLTVFLTDRADVGTFVEVRDRVMGAHKPGAIILVVKGLARPELKIEIEAIAAKID